jgi:hypothetical protein
MPPQFSTISALIPTAWAAHLTMKGDTAQHLNTRLAHRHAPVLLSALRTGASLSSADGARVRPRCSLAIRPLIR